MRILIRLSASARHAGLGALPNAVIDADSMVPIHDPTGATATLTAAVLAECLALLS